jgi:hypothetical protein
MNSRAPCLLRRCLTLLLAGLLALGPFLHGHFGASHDTGFHLDGVHAVHAAQVAALPGLSALQSPDEESPALGVANTLPHSDDKSLPDLAWVLLLMAVLPLLPLLQRALPHPGWARAPSGPLYRAGLPPPCLAPPAA